MEAPHNEYVVQRCDVTRMKRIGLVVKKVPTAVSVARTFETWLQKQGITVVNKTGWEPGNTVGKSTRSSPDDLDCVFVLGGDGTFLSAVRWVGNQAIPMAGVKFGDVGFLAEIVEDQLFQVAETVIAGKFTVQQRMRLHVTVKRDGAVRASETVLNDVVINKGALARLSDILTFIDDHYLTTYRADGLILASPTGSTAYSLAAGGPIIHPAVPGILMTPICPFTLTNRPLVVPDQVTIRIELEKESTDTFLTCDGQQGFAINHQDTVVVQKSDYPVHMINIPNQHYYDVLKSKLRWSGGRV